MKTRFQKTLLALLLVLAVFVGCGAHADADRETAIDRMCQDYFQLLQIKVQTNQIHGWLLDYIDAYLQERSWDSLLKARAAASAGLVALKQTELPAMSLTEEDCILLMDAGIEVDVLLMEYENMENWHSQTINDWLSWCYTLEDDAYLWASVEEAIPVEVGQERSYLTLECRYYSNMANYLLLQMGLSQELWNQWLEQLPGLAAAGEEWCETTKEVEARTMPVLDELALLEIRMGNVLGTASYLLEIVQDAIETGDLTEISRELAVPSGVPGFFPIPAWMPDTENWYLVTDPDSGEKRLVQAGQELSDAPATCYIQCGAIALEDIENYQSQLEALGIFTHGKWGNTEEEYLLLVKSGESTMLIKWTPEEAAIYLTEPIGFLIPELYYLAMQQ